MLEDLIAALNGNLDSLTTEVAEWFVAAVNEESGLTSGVHCP